VRLFDPVVSGKQQEVRDVCAGDQVQSGSFVGGGLFETKAIKEQQKLSATNA
jgi:hypothetical protein